MTEEIISTEAFKASMENDTYKYNTKKLVELARSIMEHLGPKGKALFLEYDILSGLNNYIYSKNAYQIGLEAGREAAQEPGGLPNKMPNKNYLNIKTAL